MLINYSKAQPLGAWASRQRPADKAYIFTPRCYFDYSLHLQWIYLAYKSFGRRCKTFESPSKAFGRTYKGFCERNDSLSGLLIKWTSDSISTAIHTVPRQLFTHPHNNCSLIPTATVHFLSCRSYNVWIKRYNTPLTLIPSPLSYLLNRW